MGHSSAEKAASHERIVVIAARRFREGGFEAVSIADIMAEAGLTHGGFYKHFQSRDALVSEAVVRSFLAGKARLEQLMRTTDSSGLEAFLEVYLSQQHLADPGAGCPVAALAADASRSPVAQEAFGTGFEKYADWVAAMLEGPSQGRRARAASIICTIAGTVAVARSLRNPALAGGMLDATRRMVLSVEAGPSDVG
ncbi:TetR/AcrR family transcriptional regulator [Nocardia noduli]|uniref:TetR/AcrR family transcriptional regulator n=1 Tax=Nocardia noduli TaxID=2815722 RepID=UPI001C22C728|nr:TetR/AcrR family transcriptional regulator [Nocardia noduli]